MHLAILQQAKVATLSLSSNRHGEVIERYNHSPVRWRLDCQLIVAAADVLVTLVVPMAC